MVYIHKRELGFGQLTYFFVADTAAQIRRIGVLIDDIYHEIQYTEEETQSHTNTFTRYLLHLKYTNKTLT